MKKSGDNGHVLAGKTGTERKYRVEAEVIARVRDVGGYVSHMPRVLGSQQLISIDSRVRFR